jgi:hypothetical protein
MQTMNTVPRTARLGENMISRRASDSPNHKTAHGLSIDIKHEGERKVWDGPSDGVLNIRTSIYVI